MALYNGSEKFSSQIGIAQYADVTDLMKHMTIEVGDVGQVMLPLNENENKRRYLNGQAILQEQFPRFTAKLKAAVSLYPSLACTEAQWQAKRLADPDDQCAKFVIDDVAGTVRLPRVKFLCGNLNLYKLAEGIPNRRLVKAYKSGTQWYNLYSDGWCEQGGNINAATYGGTVSTVTLMIPYLDTNYNLIGVKSSVADTGSVALNLPANSKTTTSFNWSVAYSSNLTRELCWRAEGYANKPNQTVQYGNKENQFEFPYYIQVSTGVDYEVDVTNHITTNLPYSFGMIQRTNNKLNNISWLQSDNTFHNGNAYPDFYQWLLREKNNTESDITVKFSTDSDITEYDYVINTSDATFKLPTLTGDEQVQDKDSYEDLSSQYFLVASEAKTYTAPYNGYFYGHLRTNAANQYISCYNDAIYYRTEVWASNSGHMINLGPLFLERGQILTDIRANFVNATDRVVRFYKAKSGYKYLYFYVGETMQDANLINVGRIVEAGAQLTTLVQLSEELGPMRTRYVVETWDNGTNGYMIYNDNYCIQYGVTDFTSWTTNGNHASVSFFKEMADTNYQKTATMLDHTANWPAPGCCIDSWSTTGLDVSIAAIGNNQGTARMSWRIEGYMAQE